jgi:hypothetical protein
MEDRRHIPRRYLNYFSRVTERRTGQMLGYLVDLTTSGALLVGNIALDSHIDYELAIELPEGLHPDNRIALEARVMWVQPDEDPEFFRTGLQLTRIDPNDLAVLEKLLHLYSI